MSPAPSDLPDLPDLPTLRISAASDLGAVDPAAWDALVAHCSGNAFLLHAYLHTLHSTGCASADTGWQPHYLLAHGPDGALPLYLKAHSYGEYVFDWSWADAWHRAGGRYYPKLLAAVPFTPCSGPRLLADRPEVAAALCRAALTEARRLAVSSLHVLFPDPAEHAHWQAAGLMLREGVQFHWHNADYADFDAFLAALSHDKRKRIRQDRRYVREAGVEWRILRGPEIGAADWAFFHSCYSRTYYEHGHAPYLSLDFFQTLGPQLGTAPLLFIGSQHGQPCCAALCIHSGDTLYGRYWGSLAEPPIRSLHFEACYYQPLDWCIRHRVQRFEGGAQGTHKLARGLLPATTHSWHWIADPRFADAVRRHLQHERALIAEDRSLLQAHSPFRTPDESREIQ